MPIMYVTFLHKVHTYIHIDIYSYLKRFNIHTVYSNYYVLL